MTYPQVIASLTDAFRFWGAIAGVIGLADILAGRFNSHMPKWSEPITQVGICTFLIIMGLLLPLARRGHIDSAGAAYSLFIMAAWYVLAASAWAAVSRYVGNITFMRAAAWLAMALCLAASFATAT